MYLHGMDIIHGNVTPVGKPKERASPHSNPRQCQSNILIAQDGRVCLGEFGLTGAFPGSEIEAYELGTLRYMAPERLLWRDSRSPKPSDPSKESDVYSLAMTSFSVRPPL